MPIVQAPPVHPEIVARQVTQAGDICVVLHNHIYNMHMDYDFDPTKSAANLKKHGVDFDEAATCLLDEMARVREDSEVSGEQRWILLGMSRRARLLVVVYTMRGETPRIISARKATSTEEKDYAY